MIDPSKISHGTVDFYTFNNLHVLGRKTIGACVGILRPKVVIDRAMQTRVGFEALCYHEGTHAYERHRFAALLLLLVPVIVSIVGAHALDLPWLLAGSLSGPALWLWWAREQELRADAVALYGAGTREFWALLLEVGDQRTWFGRWCYGKNINARELRAQKRCSRVGWTLT